MKIGTINITIEGIGPDEVERCRRIIHTLFERKVFAVRNGTVEISFDADGLPGSIKTSFLWRRDKAEKPLAQFFENAKIEVAIEQFK